jgi:hypothetical protein
MGTMGFSPEKFYGSVSQFTPSDQATNVSRNIQFHEPHPDKKIPFLLARRIGRRLNWAFDWSGDIFVLKP